MWKSDCEQSKGLSSQTFECAVRTCKGIIGLVRYLFDRYPSFDFILLGNICSDYLEGRSGWYRQLCGGNYYNFVIQFLQAEKTIRLRSLVDMGYDMKQIKTIRLRSLVDMGYDMKQIKTIFKDAEINSSLDEEEEIKSFLCDLELFQFNDGNTLHNSEEAIIYYVAGYIAKSLSKSKCDVCNVLISPEKEDLPLIVEELSNDVSQLIIEAKEEFIHCISNQRGLIKTIRLYLRC